MKCYVINRHFDDSLQKLRVCFPWVACRDEFNKRIPCQGTNARGEGGGKAHLPPAWKSEGQHSDNRCGSPESTAQKQKGAGAAEGDWHRLYRDIRSHQEVLD